MKTTMNDAEANASISRRSMLQLGGIGAIGGAMAIEAGGLLLSPIEAHAQALPLKVFTKAQGDLLGTLGGVLLPGARARYCSRKSSTTSASRRSRSPSGSARRIRD
jgi:hypothetical protein